MNFAEFMVYDEKFEKKEQVIWSGSFWAKVRGTQTGRVVTSFVVLSRILLSGVSGPKTASTLAGEYVTAQEHVGKPEVRSKFWDKNTLYKERAKRRRSGEAMEWRTTYVVLRVGS